ncbi:hypothetical protein [Lonepinella sp. BR2882]|uniref:hypothetical protein n=1 Tax=Lonepinella sp. BR2882 TaxID=3095283 RepID=UPI003F6DFE6B
MEIEEITLENAIEVPKSEPEETTEKLTQELAESLGQSKLGLSDKELEELIKNSVVGIFEKTGLKIQADDPIFAFILSHKGIADYYTKMIVGSLKDLPDQIGESIDEHLNDRLALLQIQFEQIGDNIDSNVNQVKTQLETQTLNLNNQIVANFGSLITEKTNEAKTIFGSMIEEKIAEAKNTLEATEVKLPQQSQSTQPNTTPNTTTVPQKGSNKLLSLFLISFTLLNSVIAGLTLFSVNKTSREDAYQMGLYKGFDEVKKTLPPKDAEKVQKIIVDRIDYELKTR